MKFNKENFMKSELGGNLDEIIKSWDNAIETSRVKFWDKDARAVCSWCQAQWEIYQIMFRQFYGIEYHFSRTDDHYGICTDDYADWLIRIER